MCIIRNKLYLILSYLNIKLLLACCMPSMKKIISLIKIINPINSVNYRVICIFKANKIEFKDVNFDIYLKSFIFNLPS